MNWRERIRVVERTEKNILNGEIISNGWEVQLRMSGDEEPELWKNPMRARVTGPPEVVDAFDGVRVYFDFKPEADLAAEIVCTALEESNCISQ